METEALTQLLQAEKKAEQLRQNALREAEFIIEKAKKDSEMLLKKEAEQLREQQKMGAEDASVGVKKDIGAIKKVGDEKAQLLRKSAEKNMQNAVSLILEKLDFAAQ